MQIKNATPLPIFATGNFETRKKNGYTVIQ